MCQILILGLQKTRSCAKSTVGIRRRKKVAR